MRAYFSGENSHGHAAGRASAGSSPLIVILVVVGSSPISHPNKHSLSRYKLCSDTPENSHRGNMRAPSDHQTPMVPPLLMARHRPLGKLSL
jgi:hypothetical protein